MKASRLRVGALIAVGILAGCGASQQPQDETAPNGTQGSVRPATVRPMPQGTSIPVHRRGPKRSGWLSPAAKVPGRRLLYVSQEYASDVVIYPEKGDRRKPIGMITAGVNDPWGLYIDNHGTLYVANQGNYYSSTSTVTAYSAGSTSPSLTFSQDLSRPLYPIVDSSGDVFVSNAGGYTTSEPSYAQGGTVVEYRSGSTSAYQVLQTPGIEADGMDFDQQGNLYVAYRTSDGTGSVEEFAAGSTQGKVLGMSLNQPQGLLIDNVGNIVVVETGDTNRIDVFPPGQQTPSVEVPIANTPNQLAIRQTEPRLFIAAEGGTVYGIKYPFLRTHPRPYVKEKLNSVIQGVALSNQLDF
jgi:sugar lactone lactonase YvrE